MINAHTHLYQNFLKGLNDGVPLVEWCDDVLFPAADVIHAEHWEGNDQRLGYAWSLAAALERFIRYARGFDDVWWCRRVDIARHWPAHPSP